MKNRNSCLNPSCINTRYAKPNAYKCGWCKKLEGPNLKLAESDEPCSKGVESESAQVGRMLVKLINKYKANKDPKLSKMIKSLKDNPKVNSLAYIQAKGE